MSAQALLTSGIVRLTITAMESPTPPAAERDDPIPLEAIVEAETVASSQEHLSLLRRLGGYLVRELTKVDRSQQARLRYHRH
jgi:hypothetical protein